MTQLAAGLVLGGVFVWCATEYGWESPKTIWAALIAFGVVLAVNLADLRAQIADRAKSTHS